MPPDFSADAVSHAHLRRFCRSHLQGRADLLGRHGRSMAPFNRLLHGCIQVLDHNPLRAGLSGLILASLLLHIFHLRNSTICRHNWRTNPCQLSSAIESGKERSRTRRRFLITLKLSRCSWRITRISKQGGCKPILAASKPCNGSCSFTRAGKPAKRRRSIACC